METSSFSYRFQVLKKRKLIKTNSQTDKSRGSTRVTREENNVKSYKKQNTSLRFSEKKVLHFKESIAF